MMTSPNGEIFRVTGSLWGDFPHKGHWRRALMFSLICASKTGWVNNGDAGDLRRHCAHYGVAVIWFLVTQMGVSWNSVIIECATAHLLSCPPGACPDIQYAEVLPVWIGLYYSSCYMVVRSVFRVDLSSRWMWTDMELSKKYISNRACQPGGHYRNYYSGALRWNYYTLGDLNEI